MYLQISLSLSLYNYMYTYMYIMNMSYHIISSSHMSPMKPGSQTQASGREQSPCPLQHVFSEQSAPTTTTTTNNNNIHTSSNNITMI